MSDFDKEAEREKLREKFEDEGRAATEQMSELLLKGATMTNAHCTECGDPVFRYDGQEFCPTCQKPVDRDQSDADDEDIHVTDPSDDARVQFGGENGPDDHTAPKTDEQAQGSEPAEPESPTETTESRPEPSADQPTSDLPAEDREPTPSSGGHSSIPDQPNQSQSSPSPPEPSAGDSPPRTADPAPEQQSEPRGSAPNRRLSPAASGQPEADTTPSEHLSTAESRLAETVRRFSEQAALTDDPRRAREYLEAAREAAETLDAVRF
jgi:uncharacterized Zn finger protein (UPF0148 family)